MLQCFERIKVTTGRRKLFSYKILLKHIFNQQLIYLILKLKFFYSLVVTNETILKGNKAL